MRPLLAGAVILALLAACGRTVDPQTAVPEATALHEQGKSGEARILLKNALAQQPDLYAARVVLARIALDEGDAKAASDELSALDQAAAQAPDARLVHAQTELALGRAEQTLRLLEDAGDSLPVLDATLLKAATLRSLGRPAEGLVLVRQLQAQHPDDSRLAIETAACLAAMGSLSAATAEIDRFLALPDAPRSDALRARGDLKLRQGMTAEAIEDLRAALQAAPGSWPRMQRMSTELMIGEALLARGDAAGARAQLDAVDKRWPGILATETLRARLALLEGRTGEAVDRLTALADAAPDSARLQYLLIDALVRAGNVVRATALLERQVAREPAESSPARRALAVLWMQQGRPDRVVELLGTQGETDLPAAGSEDLLVAARSARARAGAAITTLSAQLAKNPGDPALRESLAAAHMANGEPAAALATLGPAPAGGWTAGAAAVRTSAVMASGNELEINKLVDRLVDPAAGTGVPVLLAASDVLQRQRHTVAVSRLLERAAALDAGSHEVKLRRANLAFEAGRFDDASAILAQIAESQPDLMAVRVALARIAEARGDPDGARTALRAALVQDPASIDAALMLAGIELRAGRISAANAAIDALLQANPASAAANAAGLALARANRFDEARTRFRQAAEREPQVPEYWYNLGQSQLSLADRSAARESFVRAAALEPGSLRAVGAAVRLSLEARDAPAARQAADAAVKALPDSPGAWLLLGEAAWGQGDVPAANQAFARSAGLRPSAAAALGEFRVRVAQRAPRAETPLLNWLAREPEDIGVRRTLAAHYLSGGNTRAAAAQLELMLRQAPHDVASLNNLAWLLRDTDRPRAEQLALQAHAIAPENPAVADTLGSILIANGKVEAALPLLVKAAAGLPRDRAVQLHYAQALARSDRRAEAREVLQRILADGVEFSGRDEARRLMEGL